MDNDIDHAISRVRAELAPLEPQRAQMVAANQRDQVAGTLACLGGLLLAAVLISAGHNTQVPAFMAGAIGVIIGVVFFIRAHNRGGRFRGQLKLELMRRLLDAVQPGLLYDPSSGIPKSMFTASRLFSQTPDRYKVEDLIRGRVGKTDIMLSEVHAQYRSTTTDSKGRTQTTYHTFFRGLFISADFHKHFRSTLRVMPNGTSFLGGLGRALSAFRPFSSEKLVRLEDPEFEQAFNVYGSDDIEARYILSPGMMQRILELRRRWNNEIRLSFIDSKVCIAIQHRRNLFEPQLSQRADCQQQLQQIAGEIRTCLDLVDDLNLNTRIWSKE
jgi:hypothetical protein